MLLCWRCVALYPGSSLWKEEMSLGTRVGDVDLEDSVVIAHDCTTSVGNQLKQLYVCCFTIR